MDRRDIEVEPVTELSGLEALADDWRGLFEASLAGPFQSPDWLIPWTRTFVSQGLWTLAIRAGGRLIGVAPLFVHTRAKDGARQLTLLGNGISDRLDLIAAPGEAAAVAQAAFSYLARRGDIWDLCDLRDVPAGSPLLSTAAPGAAGDHRQPEDPCPVLPLPADPEAMVERLPRRRRDDLRRCARRAAEAGRISFETADDANHAECLAEIRRIHALRWQARGEAGVLADGRVTAFHDAATPQLMAAGLLRLHLLRLDGRAVAGQYAFHCHGRGYSYLTSFDPVFARFSPGVLLTAFTLQQAVREGAGEFDFLRGREPYKYEWGAVDTPQFRRIIRR